MGQRDKARYRTAARELVPDITPIEWRYCWRAAIPLFMLKAKIEVLRAEPRPNELYGTPKSERVKARRRPKRDPYWGVGLPESMSGNRPRAQLQSPDDMPPKARALLRKLVPD